jgi:hypothetical protein
MIRRAIYATAAACRRQSTRPTVVKDNELPQQPMNTDDERDADRDSQIFTPRKA